MQPNKPTQGTQITHRWPYYAAALAFVAVGYYVGWIGKDTLVVPSFLVALVCIALANLDRFKSFKAAGVEAVLRDAQVAVQESRDLALLVAQMLLSLVKRTGRIGSFSPAQEKEFEEAVDRILTQFNVTGAERREIFKDWDMFIKADYVFGILGGSTLPQFQSDGGVGGAAWEALRQRAGQADFPAPEELTQFLERYGFLAAERKELIEDYSYFLKHLKHRRPEVWERRKEWDAPLGKGNWD